MSLEDQLMALQPQGSLEDRLNALTPSANNQQSGNIPKPSAFLPTRQQLPALAGATIAGLATGGLGPAAAIGLVGLGGAAGEAYKQLAERSKLGSQIMQEEPPKTSGEAAGNIAKQGAIAAASELGGQGISWGINKMGAGQALENAAQLQGRRALGYTKRFLKTETSREAGKDVAKTMLDEGVITPLSSAPKMLDKVMQLQDETGQKIGQYLDSKGIGFDPNSAIQKLEELRPKFSGGDYNIQNGAIDNAIATIKAHGNSPISWTEANDLKGLLQRAAPYEKPGMQTVAGQTKADVAGAFKDYLDSSLDAINGGGDKEFAQFIRDKQVYKSTKGAEKALNNRISSEEGNKPFGLMDVLGTLGGIGAGAASGHGSTGAVLGGAAAAAGGKFIDRYGNQITASALRSASNPLGAMNPIRPAVRTTIMDYLNNQ